ncbi:MAG TPA: ZIP family metal transporter [bacterium]|nr:ZIP family metal transporter [bacterium]
MLQSLPIFWLSVLASLSAGLATGVGALPVFALHRVSQRAQVAMLGFGAGVMLAASFFSLLVPALAAAGGAQHPMSAALVVAGGLLLGDIVVGLANRWLPHEHFVKGREGIAPERLKQIWLFVLAITLHNFPEGLSVGVGFGTGQVDNGLALTIGIALQNMPEGLAVALALHAAGDSRLRAFWLALLTGLVEPIGAALGAGVIVLSAAVLPVALAFAAGAMLYVISGEIIPETHRGPAAGLATQGVLAGFVLMMVLDVALG